MGKMLGTQVWLRINIPPASPCWCLDTSLHNCVTCARLPESAVCTYCSSPKGILPLFNCWNYYQSLEIFSQTSLGCSSSPPFNKLLYKKRNSYLQMFSDVIGYLQHFLRMDGFYSLHQKGQGEDRRLDGHTHRCQGVLGHSRTQKYQICACFLPLLKRRLSDTDRPWAEPPASPDSKSHFCHNKNTNN